MGSSLKISRNGSKSREDEVSFDNAIPVFPGYSPDITPLLDEAHGAASTQTATLAADAGEWAYLSQVIVSGLGATGAGASVLTIAGVDGDDITVDVIVPAGATVPITPVILRFDPPLRGSAAAQDITAAITTFGAGNTKASVHAIGFKHAPIS